MVSYRAVNIPADRILIIDKQGRVRRADAIGYETSFMSLAMETVDYIFPPLVKRKVKPGSTVIGKEQVSAVALAPAFYKAHDYRWALEMDLKVQ